MHRAPAENTGALAEDSARHEVPTTSFLNNRERLAILGPRVQVRSRGELVKVGKGAGEAQEEAWATGPCGQRAGFALKTFESRMRDVGAITSSQRASGFKVRSCQKVWQIPYDEVRELKGRASFQAKLAVGCKPVYPSICLGSTSRHCCQNVHSERRRECTTRSENHISNYSSLIGKAILETEL